MKNSRQGSALLIVLGFLSFMVVSAVAFAIYMRAERMPSSALRRAITTRHLVKAALAEAMSRLDDAIRDDPFPGLIATNSSGEVEGDFYRFRERDFPIDFWQGRVFMPPDPMGGTTTAERRFAPITETVSVLTLEGLGYVPPPLVNDVRFLSRSSWAASWNQLPFESGRFAYCAVNVSDYIDINKVSASSIRNYDSPLSFAHAFDQNYYAEDVTSGENSLQGNSVSSFNASEIQKFNTLTGRYGSYVAGKSYSGDEKWTAIGQEAPYVSMLDYNLALGSINGTGSLILPTFYKWLANNGSVSTYYTQNDQNTKSALRQPFVTDSAPAKEKHLIENEDDCCNVSDIRCQPFIAMRNELKKNQNATFGQIIARGMANYQGGVNFLNRLTQEKVIGAADIATLWDYLDHDDVPLTLAMPCVERVPMIAGLTPPVITLGPIQMGQTTGTAPDDVVTTWTFDPKQYLAQGQGAMRVTVVFPFKHGEDRDTSYKAQVMLRVVMAPEAATAASLKAAVLPTQTEWNNPESRDFTGGNSSVLSFTALSKKFNIKAPTSVRESKDAFVGGDASNGSITMDFGDFGSFSGNMSDGNQKIFTKTVKTVQKMVDGEQKTEQEVHYQVNATPLKEDGTLAYDTSADFLEKDFTGITVVPHVFVWVRILNSQGKTVDLVPAGLADNQIVNAQTVDQDWNMLDITKLTGGMSDSDRPVFHFVPNNYQGLDFGALPTQNFNGGGVAWKTQGIYAVDPRSNYAPELWYDAQTANISFDDWLTKTKQFLDGHNECDEDIFMFNSSEGFLQSIGELSFLPYIHAPGDDIRNIYAANINLNGNGAFQGDADTVWNNGNKFLWRTYKPDEMIELARDAKVFFSKGKRALVNPHTENPTVMLSALANTPCDFWALAQGVNDSKLVYQQLGNTSSPGFLNENDAKPYALNGKNHNPLNYEELIEVTKTIMAGMGGIGLGSNNDSGIRSYLAGKLSNVDQNNIRSSIAKKLKKDIRDNGTLPSLAWEKIWNELWNECVFGDLKPNQDSSFEDFFGVQLSEPLHLIDRKFLYSFWKDCFANNQQLFLVFVRAESSAIGGPGEGSPGQLGGRAVALVWRDPDWSTRNGATTGKERDKKNINENNVNFQHPHPMRVLFYHQFD